MTRFTDDRLFADSAHGGDVHDSYGGNSAASHPKDNDSVEWLAFGELAQRAASIERNTMPPGESDIRRLRQEPQFDDDLPEAIARSWVDELQDQLVESTEDDS